MQVISREGGYCAINVGDLCAHFVDTVASVKIQVENGLSKFFHSQGQTIDTSDQAIFILKDSDLHDDEEKKMNTSNPLTAAQRQSGHFFVFHDGVPPRPG